MDKDFMPTYEERLLQHLGTAEEDLTILADKQRYYADERLLYWAASIIGAAFDYIKSEITFVLKVNKSIDSKMRHRDALLKALPQVADNLVYFADTQGRADNRKFLSDVVDLIYEVCRYIENN